MCVRRTNLRFSVKCLLPLSAFCWSFSAAFSGLLLFQKKQWVAPEIQLTYIYFLLELLECDFFRESEETLLIGTCSMSKDIVIRPTNRL